MSSDEFNAQVEAYFDRAFEFSPTTASSEGLHEYDPLVGPRDRASIEAYLADLRAFEESFASFDPASLTESEALDRELLLREIRGTFFWYEDVGVWRKNPRFYSGQMNLTNLLLQEYAPLAERMASIVSRLEQFPSLVEAARSNIDNPPRPFVETALITYRGMPSFLENDLTAALAEVDDPELQERFSAARDQAVAALNGYAEFLETEVLPAAEGEYALGSENYSRMNSLLSGFDLPLDQLKAIGEEELERVQGLAYELALEITSDVETEDRDAVIRAAFEALGEDSPEPDAIVESAAGVIGELKTFVDQSRFGTVLEGDVVVREIPPFARTNFAYIQIPGPFEETAKDGMYFIQPVEPDWSEAVTEDFLRTNNSWAILNVSGHEAYPGHYHHFNHIVRAPSMPQQLLTAYVTTEGWAHYTEEATWRHGLADGNPRLGLAVAQDALLRIVRYLASIGLHTEGMTVDEAEVMFRTVAYQDSVNARQQALRGTYDPGYLNYTLGKIMIQRLLEDARSAAEARGEELDLQAFHDDFMATGAPPIPWIGRRMLNDPEWEALR